jgi:hypothetical protein
MFSATMSDPVTIFLDLNKLTDSYSVSFQIGTGPETSFFTGRVDAQEMGTLSALACLMKPTAGYSPPIFLRSTQ